MNLNSKTCLIISYGPVPTPDFQTVEGGGMRAWGLAKGLQKNGVDVTVAMNASFEQIRPEFEGVKLVNWDTNPAFIELLNSFDSVIISYCMGDPSVFVAENINDDTLLILDCYVPIYIEVSARDAKDMPTELRNYYSDMERHNKTLKRGDFFLCANNAQKIFYNGVLSALGIINPHSYKDERILLCPFGVHDKNIDTTENPYTELGVTEKEFVVLWFGGLYPWFRVDELLVAISIVNKENKNIKFVFVGGKNPFNPNPDFQAQYDKAVNFSKKNKLTGKQVHFVDWVDYDTRINWFRHADVIISLNKPGEENKLSWRTRVMDFVWSEASIITNGGDPLSDQLVNGSAAIKIDELTAKAISSSILQIAKDPTLIAKTNKNILAIKKTYYWEVVTKLLSEHLSKATKHYVKEQEFLSKNDILRQADAADIVDPSTVKSSKISKLVGTPLKIVRTVRSKGVRSSVKIGLDIFANQARNNTVSKDEKKYIFISHPMTMTGAPMVLLDVIEEVVEKYGPKNILLVTPSMTDDVKARVARLGIRSTRAVHGLGFRFVRAQLGIKPDDFVMINTIAIYDNYRDFIMLWLKLGRLKTAHWFIHEDPAQIPNVNPPFMDAPNIKRIHNRIESNKLHVYTPSQRTSSEYGEIFSTDKINSMVLKVHVADRFIRERKVQDYQEINFYLQGTPSDGRKAQLLFLSALQKFYLTSYRDNPKLYREFSLHLVAIADDYISKQIKWIADGFDDRVKVYGSMPKDDAMEVADACNAVVCLSLNETFGLYIAEGMLMGHILLRNNSSGIDEQLVEGKNGYQIYNEDIDQIVQTIEKVLNKNMSDKKLHAMGRVSLDLASEWPNNTFLDKFKT
jgi:glycosyltransferase involved in cell wall biosynthesis